MLYKDLHWRRGRPGEPGTYLVFDGPRGRIAVAVVTGLTPFRFRAGPSRNGGEWGFRAYLGPLDRPRAGGAWPRGA